MSMAHVKKRMRDGSTKVYEYEPRYYYVPQIEKAREFLKKRPLRQVRKGPKRMARWTGGQRGPVFNDSVVSQLIAEGYAVCVGEFVEKKGVTR